MQRALDIVGVVVVLALGERSRLVCAHVVDRAEPVSGADDAERADLAPDLGGLAVGGSVRAARSDELSSATLPGATQSDIQPSARAASKSARSWRSRGRSAARFIARRCSSEQTFNGTPNAVPSTASAASTG